jgi:hypothetical protein
MRRSGSPEASAASTTGSRCAQPSSPSGRVSKDGEGGAGGGVSVAGWAATGWGAGLALRWREVLLRWVTLTAHLLSRRGARVGRGACGRDPRTECRGSGGRGALCSRGGGVCSGTRRCRCCSRGGGLDCPQGCGWMQSVFVSWCVAFRFRTRNRRNEKTASPSGAAVHYWPWRFFVVRVFRLAHRLGFPSKPPWEFLQFLGRHPAAFDGLRNS